MIIERANLEFLFLAFAFATANRIRHTMKLVWLAVANMLKAQAWLHATIWCSKICFYISYKNT